MVMRIVPLYVPSALAAKQATREIPIVIIAADPGETGAPSRSPVNAVDKSRWGAPKRSAPKCRRRWSHLAKDCHVLVLCDPNLTRAAHNPDRPLGQARRIALAIFAK